MVLTLRLCVAHVSQNKEQLLYYTALTCWLCINEEVSVYSAVRTDKADYVWSLNNRGGKCLQRGKD